MSKRIIILCLMITTMLYGCATSTPGSFTASSYVQNPNANSQFLGEVTGLSTQRWILYLIPVGEAPSTHQAIENAKQQISDTRFLTDISIDERTDWNFGYSEQIIVVSAHAYH